MKMISAIQIVLVKMILVHLDSAISKFNQTPLKIMNTMIPTNKDSIISTLMKMPQFPPKK